MARATSRATTPRAPTTRPTTRRRAADPDPTEQSAEDAPFASEPTQAISALLGAANASEPEPFQPTYVAQRHFSSMRAAPLPIGEEDRNIFACPVCMRPLATGVRRCPGCSTRLVMGIPVKRAGALVTVGLLIGVLGGGGIVAAAGGLTGGAAVQPSQPLTGGLPSDSPAPSASIAPTPTPTPAVPDVPPTARAALGQVGTTNVRLLESAAELRDALAASALDASAIAATLRSMNSDAAFGIDVAKRLAAWPAAESLAADLDAFYEAVRAIAREGLAASVRNEAAYEAAATDMLNLMTDVEALDAEARALAGTAGVDLPPLDLAPLGRASGDD